MKPTLQLAQMLDRLFTRRNDGWGARDRIEDSRHLLQAIADGAVKLYADRLPLSACTIAATADPIRTGGESLWHARLKVAGALALRQLGCKDVKVEAQTIGGYADVYSADTHWIVECGNTRFSKLASAVLHRSQPQFTLIPYQALTHPNGTPRRLISIDFMWSPTLTRRLNDEADVRALAAIACLELDDLEEAGS